MNVFRAHPSEVAKVADRAIAETADWRRQADLAIRDVPFDDKNASAVRRKRARHWCKDCGEAINARAVTGLCHPCYMKGHHGKKRGGTA